MKSDSDKRTAVGPVSAEGSGGWLREHRTTVVVALAILAAFALGYFTGRAGGPREVHEHTESDERKPLFWTCSMHPQVKQPGPGKCPICSMDLIPVYEGIGEALGPRELRLSETARKLAGIRTAPVERRFVETEVRMVGKVEYDETRLAHITAWVPGRLDRLYVDYTGIPVKKGDHMVWLYSPEILAAQEELLQAVRAARELEGSAVESIRRTAQATVTAAREKLRLWGLTEKQIAEIERLGKPSDHVTVHAPAGGIVVEKHAVEGMYVKTGMRIYTIADLSRVWVKLDAYESDLPWVRYGQGVEFTTGAYPGESFGGRIAFVDPVLDAKTRTVKVRVNVPNPAGRLKPGMFIRAVVRAKVAKGGGVADPDLAGKWISPMHPEIVKDGPGTCDVCGMPLVRAETLGYVTPGESRPPLVIPATAPLVTGERAVVYVAVPGEEGVFEGREVVLGPRAGDHYVVKSGLDEGERVVTNGSFKIDSALQILAKPSMMSPEGGGPAPGHRHHGAAAGTGEPHERAASQARRFDVPLAFRQKLHSAYEAYFELQGALSRDRLSESKMAAVAVLNALDGADMLLMDHPASGAWEKEVAGVRGSADRIGRADDLVAARAAFKALSDSLISVARRFGIGDRATVYRIHCPMAFGNRGADWLSSKREVENPYFGAAMFRCGEVTEVISEGSGREGE